jgi:hypothetical protein
MGFRIVILVAIKEQDGNVVWSSDSPLWHVRYIGNSLVSTQKKSDLLRGSEM